jgi:hypothetical protein
MTNINDLLKMTLRRKNQIVKPKPSAATSNPRSMMNEVVPHLTSDDFLSKWKKDVQELKQTKEELNKYKKIVNTRFSSEWREALSEEEKAKSKISKK